MSHVTNKRSSLSVIVSRGVGYCMEFDLVLSFFAWRLFVVFAIIGMLHGFLRRKGINFSNFLSEMTGYEMISDMLVVNVFPVFATLGPAISLRR